MVTLPLWSSCEEPSLLAFGVPEDPGETHGAFTWRSPRQHVTPVAVSGRKAGAPGLATVSRLSSRGWRGLNINPFDEWLRLSKHTRYHMSTAAATGAQSSPA